MEASSVPGHMPTPHRDQLQAVLGALVEGILAVGLRDEILFCNRAAESLFGTRQLVGSSLISLDGGPLMVEMVEAARTGGRRVAREFRVERGGEELTFDAHAAPFAGGGASGVILALHDLTELRRLERVRRDFVANVSHELKTPLTSIRGYTETLLAGALMDRVTGERFVRKIHDNAARLNTLVQDLLHLARIEAQEGRLTLGPVSWAPIVRDSIHRHEEAMRQKGIACCFDASLSDVTVLGEQEGMTQILENLLDNAIKYTPAPGRVRVEISAEPPIGVLRVADTGVGIPANDIPRIFERFYRVDKARSRDVGGTGLGLSIVKHLVSAMGGDVRVSSTVGCGSTFEVRIPLAG